MDKDVIVTAAASAAGVGGFVLVFLGIVIGTYQSFGGDVKRRLLNRYVWSARGLLSVFVISLATVTLAIVWLMYGGGMRPLYLSAVALFLLSLFTALVVSALVTFKVLLRA